jgi:predicted ATPase
MACGACGLGYEGQLAALRGDGAEAEGLLRSCLDGLREARYDLLYTPFLGSLAAVLAAAGRFDEALSVINESLERACRNDGFWWTPEARRIKGEVLLASDDAQISRAADNFRRSLDLARRHGALFWELRAALSLARSYCDQGRRPDARDLLASVYGRFTEGFGTADLQSAKRLLAELT